MVAEVSLVHSGGGTKGALQVGATWYLLGAHGLRPTMFTGTSVGAINVTKLAEGSPLPLTGDPAAPPLSPGIEGLWSIWRSRRAGVDMMVPIGFTNHVSRDLGVEFQYGVGGPNIVTGAAAAISVVLPFMSIVTILELSDLASDLEAMARQDSMFSLQPMRDLLAGGGVSLEAVRKHLLSLGGSDGFDRLVVNYVDSRTGRTRYACFETSQPVTNAQQRLARIRDDALRPTSIPALTWPDAVLAAAAIPGMISDVKPHKSVGYDGGLREVTCLSPSIGANAPDIVAITAPAFSHRGFATVGEHPLFMEVGGTPAEHEAVLPMHAVRTIDILVDEIMRHEERPRGVVTDEGLWHVRPEIDVLGTFTVSPARIRVGARYGTDLTFALTDPALRNVSARVEARGLATDKAFRLTQAINHQELFELRIAKEMLDHFSGWAGGAEMMELLTVAPDHTMITLWAVARALDWKLRRFAPADLAVPVDTDLPTPWFDTGDRRIHGLSDDTAGDFGRAWEVAIRRHRAIALPLPTFETPQPGPDSSKVWFWPSGSGILTTHLRGALSTEYPRSWALYATEGEPNRAAMTVEDVPTEFSVEYGQYFMLATTTDGIARRLSSPQHDQRWAIEADPALQPDDRLLSSATIGIPYGLSRGAIDLLWVARPDGSTTVLIQPDRLALARRPEGAEMSELPCTGYPSVAWVDDGARRIDVVLGTPLGSAVILHRIDQQFVPHQWLTVEFGSDAIVHDAAIGQFRGLDGVDRLRVLARVTRAGATVIEQTVITGDGDSVGHTAPVLASRAGEHICSGPSVVQAPTGWEFLVYGYESGGVEHEVRTWSNDPAGWGPNSGREERPATAEDAPCRVRRYGLGWSDNGMVQTLSMFREVESGSGEQFVVHEVIEGTSGMPITRPVSIRPGQLSRRTRHH